MRKIIILFLFISLLISIGCTQKQEISSKTIKLYFSDNDNLKLVSEERKINFKNENEKYINTLKELIKGPESKNLSSNIPSETEIYGIIKQNKSLIVDLNNSFNNFAGNMAELMAIASIVNTLTQFEEVEKVKILVEGNEFIGPSGNPRGFMQPFPTDPGPPVKTVNVKLYFASRNAIGLIAETRNLQVPVNLEKTEFIKLIVQELIKGPENNDLYKTIPREVKVLSVSISEGTAHVDFSQEMHTKHWGGATGEALTIASIANTLTELEDINRVKMTVEGNPLAIEHAILDQPVGRNEDLIIEDNAGS